MFKADPYTHLRTLVFVLVLLPNISWSAEWQTSSQESSAWIEAEAGAVWQSRNEVQVPSDTGTRFSLTSLGTGPALAGRISFGYRINAQHEVRALYAPITLKLDGNFDKSVAFQGETFTAGVPTEAKYVFNSYRLTYRYLFTKNEIWTLKVGFTGKIRDAKIQLTQGARSSETKNIGFVPLLHFSATYHWTPKYRLHLDADAIAAPQGRAEDIALLAGYRPASDTEYRLGYRTVEGGASGSGGVYTFAWLHYLIAGIQHEF